MMANKWYFCVTVLLVIEHTHSRRSPSREKVPHSQAPITIRTSLTKIQPPAKFKSSKNLDERRLGQEYVEQYQEMMKASQESFESFDRDDKRLRRLIGKDDLELMAEAGGLPRRTRSGGPGQLQSSVVGRRRARSQAIRRDKLHAQGLLSHRRHSKNLLIHGDQ